MASEKIAAESAETSKTLGGAHSQNCTGSCPTPVKCPHCGCCCCRCGWGSRFWRKVLRILMVFFISIPMKVLISVFAVYVSLQLVVSVHNVIYNENNSVISLPIKFACCKSKKDKEIEPIAHKRNECQRPVFSREPSLSSPRVYDERPGVFPRSDRDVMERNNPDPSARNIQPQSEPTVEAELVYRDRTQRALEASDLSRFYLRQGDAAQAVGNIEVARDCWLKSIENGIVFGAEAALTSQKRLQAFSLSCEYDSYSLARITDITEDYPEIGAVIDLKVKQSALAALGYYNDDIDGSYGARTTSAVRSYQSEMGFDETGSLSAIETVALVCHAAQTVREPSMQNALGLMYAIGLGVVQNTDLAIRWLEAAAERGDRDAHYNLALIYGTRIVVSSYRLCSANVEYTKADYHLNTAAELGHQKAIALRGANKSAPTPKDRWVKIEKTMKNGSNPLYENRIENLGAGCSVNVY